MHRGLILLVEDNEDHVFLLQRAFQAELTNPPRPAAGVGVAPDGRIFRARLHVASLLKNDSAGLIERAHRRPRHSQ
jgi:hypothetical protein